MTIAIVKNALRSVLMLTLATPALAQRHDPPASLPLGVSRTDLKDSPGPGASASQPLGKWSYRSFRNDAIAHRPDGKGTLDELGILCEAGELLKDRAQRPKQARSGGGSRWPDLIRE
jgi:hypothetical protein